MYQRKYQVYEYQEISNVSETIPCILQCSVSSDLFRHLKHVLHFHVRQFHVRHFQRPHLAITNNVRGRYIRLVSKSRDEKIKPCSRISNTFTK